MGGNELIPVPAGEVARQAQANNIDDLIAAVVQRGDQNVAETLEKMFAFKLKVQAHDAEITFNRDFAAAKAEMPVLSKDGKKVMVAKDGADKGTIPFATYNNVNDTIGPIEQKYGFTRVFLQKPCLQKEGVIMVLRLIHRDGHTIESERYMPPDPGPGRNGAQAIGSAESYARRYMTLALWDLVARNADDDAATAECISREQADTINALISECGMDQDAKKRFLKFAEADSVSKIQQHNFDRCVKALEQKRRQG